MSLVESPRKNLMKVHVDEQVCARSDSRLPPKNGNYNDALYSDVAVFLAVSLHLLSCVLLHLYWMFSHFLWSNNGCMRSWNFLELGLHMRTRAIWWGCVLSTQYDVVDCWHSRCAVILGNSLICLVTTGMEIVSNFGYDGDGMVMVVIMMMTLL